MFERVSLTLEYLSISFPAISLPVGLHPFAHLLGDLVYTIFFYLILVPETET